MGLTQLSKQLSASETRRIGCVGVEVRIKRLSLSELQEAERLTEECSLGSGQNRHVSNLPKLVWTLASKWITDMDGKPIVGDDTIEDAKDWPATMVAELMQAFGSVNTTEKPDPN